jgi:tetratricopeptide (TPR) repeat protein
MTRADGGADQGARRGWRWDVALSFAGAQRTYVEQVARALKALGVRCFYDADEQMDLWGKHLAEELPAIYGEDAAAVVMFVSAEYAAQDWTRSELQAALARAVQERREYVLPARFDDTPLPGLQSDMVWVDLRNLTPEAFAASIARKLKDLGIAPTSAAGVEQSDEVSATVPADPVASPRAHVQRGGPLFIDRDEQRVRLREALQEDVSSIILVTGPAGVGKTRLVDEVLAGLGWDMTETTDRRLCRHDASPGTRLDMKTLIDDIEHGAAPANLYLYGPKSRARMQAALDGYTGIPVVIIVEQAECLLDDAQSLSDPDLNEALEMLSDRSRSPVKVVLVSQQVPRADGLIRWPNAAHPIALTGLAAPDFRHFLEKLDPAAECGLAALAPMPLAQVHRWLRGNPRLAELLHALFSCADRDLGVREVPAWLARGTEEEVPQRLTGELIRGLPAGQQRVIEALAAFGTPVGESTVGALLEPSLSRERVREALRTLALRRIVRLTGDQRYHLPRSDVDRSLAHLPAGDPYEEADGGPTRRNLLHRAARVLDSLQKNDDDVHGVSDLYPHFARLDVLVRAAMYGEAHEVIMAMDQLLRQWNQGPLLREQREAVAGKLDDPYAEMENRAALGDVYSSLGLLGPADSSYQAALSLARSHNSLEDLRRIYINMGQMYKEHNHFGKARDHFDNGLAIAQEAGAEADADRMAALEGLADCARALGRFTEAIRLGRAALDIAEPDESPRTVDIALKLSRWLADVDRMKDAAVMLARAEASAGYDDRSARAAWLDGRADLSFRRGGAATGIGADLDEVARAAQQAVDLALEQRDPGILRQARTTLCVVHLHRDDIPAARREIEAAARHRQEGHSLLVVALQGLVAWRGGESRLAAEIFGKLCREAQRRVEANGQDFAARDMLGVARCAEALADGTSLAPAVEEFRTARGATESAPGLARQLRFLVEQMIRDDPRPDRLRPVLDAITGE